MCQPQRHDSKNRNSHEVAVNLTLGRQSQTLRGDCPSGESNAYRDLGEKHLEKDTGM